jgi:integrase
LRLIKAQRNPYGLRRVFRTIAAQCGDEPAANRVMGHAGHSMARLNTQHIGDDRLRRIGEHVRGVILGSCS